VKEYEIIPITHCRLLTGQIKRSAAEDTITKEYYCFSYRKRNSNDEYETFIVGSHVAKHFLELLKHQPLPIFNILKDDNEKSKGQKIESTLIEKDKWNPLALELYTIINIILMIWDTNGGILSEILTRTRNNKSGVPLSKDIKSVNTIISNDRKKRTIYEMLDKLRKENKIKDFKFPLITEALKGFLKINYIDKIYITGTNDEQ
jgi:hypothetical protein